MSSGAQQLQTDFEQVINLLDQYPNIRLLQTDGDPPDRYDIEYNVKGYKANPDGTASPANKHVVRITLPFGYPHFAPTVKPLSPIFHPDIDPDAVRIADFWEKSKSLSELIIHIGQMICGALYSSAEPFNQRAFEWYEERKSWLPFEILAPRENGAPDETGTGAADLTTSDDDILTTGFDPAEEDAEARTDRGDGTPFPVEPLHDDFAFALEMEDKGDNAAGGVEGIEDWTAFQDNGNSSADDDLSSAGETAHAEDLPGEPSVEIEDIFNLEFEPSADQSETKETEAAVESTEWDLTETFRVEEEEAERSEPDVKDEDIALDLAADESPLTADREQLAGQDETTVREQGGMEAFALELDEDPSTKYGSQARSIRPLIEQKEIFTAKKVLADLADPDSVPDIEEYRQTIAAAVSEAEELYKKADKHEQNGELEKAGIVLDLVANIAIDYPGLEFARNRVRETLMAQGQKKPPPPPAENMEAPDKDKERKTSEEFPPTRKVRRQIKVKLPYKLIAVILLLAVCTAGGALLFARESKTLQLAQREFESGRQHVQNKDFKPAQRAFDTARTALNNIHLLYRGTKHDLQAQIDSIVNSAAFKEGLQGRVLYDGQYVSVETAKAMDQFKLHTAAAEKYLQAGQLDLAVESYEKSLPYIEPAGYMDRDRDIRQTVNRLRLQQTMAQAKEAEEAGKWEEAADMYQKALESGSAFATPEELEQLSLHLAAASFRHELDEGQKAFASSDWLKATDLLERAEKTVAENPSIASAAEKTELGKLLVNSRLFQLLSVARKAYELQEWDRAVTEYTKAVTLLDASGAILGKDEVADSRRKIEKTMLMTRVAREQERIDAALRNDDLEEALGHYQAIVKLIGDSPFNNDEILGKIHENASSRSVAIEKELLINRRIDWLTQNFEQIFREHYPSAKMSELSHPNATFIKREGNLMIFTMSCTEKQQGQTFRLELNYQYDMDTDTWKIYSGTL